MTLKTQTMETAKTRKFVYEDYADDVLLTDEQFKNLHIQPISQYHWVHRERLIPNLYNPNSVAPPEMDLLEISILEDGWTQPIVVNPDFTIVDGFHRYTVSGRKQLIERFGGYVPVVFTKPKNLTDQEMATIRHNRARGTHGVLPMAEIIQGMVDRKTSVEEIMLRLGMEEEEVIRLALRTGIPESDLIRDKEFGKSWKPE